jgi:hypothetical protein
MSTGTTAETASGLVVGVGYNDPRRKTVMCQQFCGAPAFGAVIFGAG